MNLNSNTTPNGTNNPGMTSAEREQLTSIRAKLNIYSALVGVVVSSLECHGLEETCAAEVVLKDLHYNLAEQAEMLEKMLESSQKQHEANLQAEHARAEKEWIDQRVANIPPEVAKAFKAANAAYAQANPPEVPAPAGTDSQALLTHLLGMLKDWRKCEMSSTEFETNLEQAVSLASSLVEAKS